MVPASVRFALPSGVLARLQAAPALAFTGSRAPQPRSLAALACVLGAARPGVPVLVGCARGIDQTVRQAVPSARVLVAASQLPHALTARSVQFVGTAAGLGAVVVAFPSGPCPAALVPSASARACFAGFGSGTWATVALAAGLGCPVLVWLPPACAAPAWLSPLGAGWFSQAPPPQLSLL